jgi:hypothetical protein
MNDHTVTSASDIQGHLHQLYAERALASVEGLDANDRYMDDLQTEIAITRSAYVGLAVTEIATLRGQLSGRLQG